MTQNKIIGDITHAISECLNFISKHDPQVYSQLIFSPYKKAIEKKLADIIYKLYHVDPKITFFFRDIFGEEAKEQYAEKIRQLNELFVNRLKQTLAIVETHRDRLNVYIWGGWVQVNPKTEVNVTRRMYLNCDPEYINIVIADLVKLMLVGFGHAHTPQIIFKFPDPARVSKSMLIRADKVVIYYGDDPVTHEILRDWVGSMAKFFREHVPLFTRKEREGVGFAYEPPPEQQEYAKLHTGEMTPFGGFMALVIARYLYAWCQLHKKIPHSGEIVRIAAEIFEEKLIKKHKYKF